MGASCNLTGKNEQETINNYADWSTGWLKTVSYDLILTIQKLKTICNGEYSSESDSVEYNALRELIGSLYKQLKEKYSDDEVDTSKYDEKCSVLKRIYDSTIRMEDELKGEKPIKIDTLRLFNSDKKKYHKIVIPGNSSYYTGFANKFRIINWFYEIDKYIHEYFGDVENPFETEFSLVFNDIITVERLNNSILDDVLWSPKKLQNYKTIDYSLEEKPECSIKTPLSVLENLKLNYPKIKFEYNENIIKEYEFNQCENTKDYKLDERIK
jgi:hypothetical protein